eukprot:365456-Chlamydomonas_euryale.AAC.2
MSRDVVTSHNALLEASLVQARHLRPSVGVARLTSHSVRQIRGSCRRCACWRGRPKSSMGGCSAAWAGRFLASA